MGSSGNTTFYLKIQYNTTVSLEQKITECHTTVPYSNNLACEYICFVGLYLQIVDRVPGLPLGSIPLFTSVELPLQHVATIYHHW